MLINLHITGGDYVNLLLLWGSFKFFYCFNCVAPSISLEEINYYYYQYSGSNENFLSFF